MRRSCSELRSGSLVCILAVIASLGFSARARASTASALKEAQRHEEQALWLEAHGDFAGAAECYEKGLDTVAKSLEELSGRQRKLAEARALVYLHRLNRFWEESSLSKRAVAVLERTIESSLSEESRSFARWFLGQHLFRLSRFDEGQKQFDSLGFVRKWLLLGPFDNSAGDGLVRGEPVENDPGLHDEHSGKLGPVRWRSVAVEPRTGYVDLDALVRPNDSVTAYALSFCRSAERRRVVFRLGSDEGVRFWLNGTLLLSRDLHRRVVLDQDLVEGDLVAGWNRLLVKVSEVKGEWGFRLRLTDSDGRPIEGLDASNDPSVWVEVARPGLPGTGPPGTASGEEDRSEGSALPSLAFLRKHCSHRRATAWDLFHLGLLERFLGSEDTDRHADRQAIEKAAEGLPDSSYFLYFLAQAYREEVAMAPEREENRVRKLLETVLQRMPQHSLAAVDLARYYLGSLGNLAKARQLLELAALSSPSLLEADLVGMEIDRGQDLDAEALRTASSLPERYPGRAAAYEALGTALARAGRYAEAAVQYRHALGKNFLDMAVRERLSGSLKRTGEPNGALDTYGQQIFLDPYRVEARLERATILQGMGKLSEAFAELDRALEICPEDPGCLALRGDLRYREGKKDEALLDWKRALQAQPGNLRLRRFVEYVEEGGQSFERPFRRPHEEWAEKTQQLAELWPDAPAVYLLQQSVIELNPDGNRAQYVHELILIAQERAVKDFDFHSLAYSATEENLHVLGARVIHPDGMTEDARINVQPPDNRDYQYFDRMVLDLPPLAVGDVVDIEYKRVGLSRGFFGSYFGDEHSFGSLYPVLESQYVLLVPAGMPIHYRMLGAQIEPAIRPAAAGRFTVYEWRMAKLPRVEIEPHMPPLEEIVPTLQVSTFRDWNEFGRWYWNLIERQHDATEAIREVVRSATEGKETLDEKIRSVYNYVVSNIRYVTWEFGVHGFKPYKASQIFSRKFGDCKDKALLMNVMFRELGIRAWPVLLRATEPRGEQDLGLPMFEHFNHCISCVELDDGSRLYLDGTAGFHAPDTLPSMDAGARVVIVKDTGAELAETQLPEPSGNSSSRKSTVRLEASGSARVTCQIEVGGEPAAEARYRFANVEKRILHLEREFGTLYPGARIAETDFSRLANLDKPVWYSFVAKLPHFVEPRQDGFAARAGFVEMGLGSFAGLAKRKYDLLLSHPWSLEEELVLLLPSGWSATILPEDVSLESSFGSYERQVRTVSEDSIEIRRKLRLAAQRVTVAEYGAFRDFSNRVDDAEQAELILSPQ